MLYVTMTDKFMSGWGEARNKKNILVFLCESVEDQENVYNNALNRSDMVNVRKEVKAPFGLSAFTKTEYARAHELINIKTNKVYPNWYVKDFFS